MSPSPPPRPPDAATRYFVRRPGGAAPTGPHTKAALAMMFVTGALKGDEEVSVDRKNWRSIRGLGADDADPAGGQPPPPPSGLRDLGGDGPATLAPLEIGFGAGAAAVPSLGGDAAGDDEPGIDLGPTLELVERKPAPPPPKPPGATGVGHEPPRHGATLAPLVLQSPGRDRGAPAHGPPPAPVERAGDRAIPPNASGAVAEFLREDTGAIAAGPVDLGSSTLAAPGAPQVDPPARLRTMTAARGGIAIVQPGATRRRSLRLIALGAGAIALVAAIAVGLALDVPGRLRGEPAVATVLGPVAAAVAEDRYPALSDAARRLEDAASTRKRAPMLRAAAAELLAATVVLHGGDRARVAHAETLLGEVKDLGQPGGPAALATARARAFVAIAKGRWAEAAELGATPGLAAGDQAALRGWVALGRGNAAAAAAAFGEAAQAELAPAPSRVAARFGLARAREAELSAPAAAEAAYRAVLKEAPAHVGAALGLARTSKLSSAGRATLAQAVIEKQARDASRAELAEALAIVAEAARARGDAAGAEAALKRAREADPTNPIAAVAAGDALLAEGRTDDAVTRYRLALLAPVGAPRFAALAFARVAALGATARTAEATAALADLDKRLPGDARAAFWRGRFAEAAVPPAPPAAERAYRDAIERDPGFLPARLALARLLIGRHDGPAALAVLRQAEARGAPPHVLQLALGQALVASGNAAEAIKVFRQALASDAADPAAQLGLAAALETGGDLEGARALLAKLDAHGAGTPAGLGTRMAAILVKLGRREDALGSYQKEIAAGGAPPSTKVAAARLALELGQRDVARTLAEVAVEDDPRTPGALLVLAEVRRADGDLGRAIAELQRALAVDSSAEAELEYGRALATLGRDEEALAALAEAKQIPASGVERGRILFRRGDVEAAAKELAVATQKLPNDAEAFLLLGRAEDRLGHTARAEAAWKAGARVAPALGEIRYRIGRLEMDRDQAGAALPHLRAAADHVPADGQWRADLYFQLGFAEKRQGSRERAAAAFRRYLEIAPADAPDRSEVERQLRGDAGP